MTISTKPLFILCRQWLLTATARRGLIAQTLLFFGICLTAFVFGIGPAPDILAATLGGLCWALLLLATLVGLPHILGDTPDDALESPYNLSVLLGLRAFVTWVAGPLPLALLAPLVMAGMTPDAVPDLWPLWAVFVPGSLLFVLLGLLGATLTLGARNPTPLMALIVVPLALPAVIFGSGSVLALAMAMNWQQPCLLLWAATIAALVTLPPVAAKILRMKQEA